MISVLILTYNEEANIGPCLDALEGWTDVVVVDSFSTDRTVEICQQRGIRLLQRKFDDFASQRNFGLIHGGLKHEWVLHLDADEIVEEPLKRELLELVQKGPDKDGYEVPSKLMFQGSWLKYSGMYPVYQVRFGHRERLRFIQVGHGQREDLPRERIGRVRNSYQHFSFSKGLGDWFAKHNRYSTDEAKKELEEYSTDGSVSQLLSNDKTTRRRAIKRIVRNMPFRPWLRFVYMYLFKFGFLDGTAGLTYCRLVSYYEFMIVVKKKEMRKAGSRPGS